MSYEQTRTEKLEIVELNFRPRFTQSILVFHLDIFISQTKTACLVKVTVLSILIYIKLFQACWTLLLEDKWIVPVHGIDGAEFKGNNLKN